MNFLKIFILVVSALIFASFVLTFVYPYICDWIELTFNVDKWISMLGLLILTIASIYGYFLKDFV